MTQSDFDMIHDDSTFSSPPVVSRLVRAAKDLPGVMFFAVAFAIVIWS
jgi:hypothetical protein